MFAHHIARPGRLVSRKVGNVAIGFLKRDGRGRGTDTAVGIHAVAGALARRIEA